MPISLLQPIAILGGTGFVGKVLAARWPKSHPFRPRFLVHRTRPQWLASSEFDFVNVSFEDIESVIPAINGCSTVVNLLRPDGTGWYPQLVKRLAPVFQRAGILRCVHASSIDVYRGSRLQFIDETATPCPVTRYEIEHLLVEEIVRSCFQQTLVLRLGAIFGPGGKNLVSLAREMRTAPRLWLVARRALYGDRRLHLVSVETVCDAIVHFLSVPLTVPTQDILVTEDDDPDNNFAFVQDTLATAFGHPTLTSVPALPKIFLAMILRLRGFPEATVRRRFSSSRLQSFGVFSNQFSGRMKSYAAYLAHSQRPEYENPPHHSLP